MALLNSENIRLGTPAPDFKLKSVDGKTVTLEDFKDKKVLVVMFICAHCPYVVAVEDRIIQLRREWEGKSVQLLGICANDPTDYPDDQPENLRKRAEAKGYGFPYLIDETQEVAKAYGAVCTPDIYVYGQDRMLAYHGRIDDNWKEPSKVTRRELKEAVDALLTGKSPSDEQMPSMGCSIKWKK
ncbi:MAG: thioredoxin family protein [bacterium]